MSYKSPIELILGDLETQVEGEILKAVQNVGVNVDKEELSKALHGERRQYEKGYKDRDDEIIRCKDCNHYRYYGLTDDTVSECTIDHCKNPDKNWYCADGEREAKS